MFDNSKVILYYITARNFVTKRIFYVLFHQVRGFGPRHKEMWMPLTAKVHRGVYDRIHVKKEFKEVAAAHNPVNNLKGYIEMLLFRFPKHRYNII